MEHTLQGLDQRLIFVEIQHKQKQELNLKNMFTKEQTTISFKSLDNLKNILK